MKFSSGTVNLTERNVPYVAEKNQVDQSFFWAKSFEPNESILKKKYVIEHFEEINNSCIQKIEAKISEPIKVKFQVSKQPEQNKIR